MIKDPLLMQFPIAVIPERYVVDKNVTWFLLFFYIVFFAVYDVLFPH